MERSAEELINGCFINIDKPEGPTSHDVDLWIRRILGVEKTGHFGTLDPMVTGVLPIAVGKATRLLQYFKSGKDYVGVLNLHEDVSEDKLREVIRDKFMGKITQLPPVKSRVKRVEREREIFEFEVLEKDGRDVLFQVKCEAGTYIRKLAHDLGEALGVGAHMTELRRTRAGMFKEESIVSLYELVDAVEEFEKGNDERLKKILQPMELITHDIRPAHVIPESLRRMRHGGPMFKEDLVKKTNFKKDEKIAVMDDGKIVLVAKVERSVNVFARPETVLSDLK